MKFLKSILMLLYISTFLVMCRYTIKHSDYDIDILMYTACAMEEDYPDKIALHQKVYQMAIDELGQAKFNQYTDSSKVFRRALYTNPDKFINMLPYYKAKGLYTALLKTSYKMGYSPIKFSTLLNLICFLVISIILLILLSEHLNFYTAFCIAYFCLLMPTFTSTLKSNTPDLFTAMLFLISIYLFLKKKDWLRYLSILFFILLVSTRSENILFVLTLTTLGIFYFHVGYSKKYFWILASTCIVAYLINSNAIDGPTWKDLYKLTNLPPEDIHSPNGEISLKEYLLGFRRIPNNIFYCEVAFILLISILPLLKFNRSSRNNIFYLLLVSNLGFLMFRILLLPDITNRYFCGSFLLAVVCYFVLNEGSRNSNTTMLKTGN